jgi:hypothetical protein
MGPKQISVGAQEWGQMMNEWAFSQGKTDLAKYLTET